MEINIQLWYLEYQSIGDSGDLQNLADAITKYHHRCITDWRIGRTGHALVIWEGPADPTDDELVTALLEEGCYSCDDYQNPHIPGP